MEHEQVGAEVSDALRAAKHWHLYQGAERRVETVEAELAELRNRLATACSQLEEAQREVDLLRFERVTQIGEASREISRLRQDLHFARTAGFKTRAEAAEDTIARVEARHVRMADMDDDSYTFCNEDGHTWPCPTIRAIRD